MSFTIWTNKPNRYVNYERSDIEKANEENRKRRELQEQYDDERRAKLNERKGY